MSITPRDRRPPSDARRDAPRPRARAVAPPAPDVAARRRRPATPAPARAAFTANLKADDFTALCELVRQLCGVDLGQYKRNQMERRVRTWTERRGTPDLAEYGKLLRKDPAELDAFLDRVTINVSHLWRHEDQFEVLRTKILPELTAERRRLKIWSAGSSYGAEAYTIAAVCRETIPNIAGRDHRHRPRQAHGRPRPRRASSPPRTPARRRRPCCSAISSRSRTAAGSPSRN